MGDDELLTEVLRHGGLPAGVHIDLLKHSIPIIRADYKGLETYVHPCYESSVSVTESSDGPEDIGAPTPPTPRPQQIYLGPVTVVGGADDVGDLTVESLRGWTAFANSLTFSFKLFGGGSHFYFMDKQIEGEVLEMLYTVCRNPEVPPFPI